MKKNEINYGIFSGELLLPFTIRSTKNQCKADRINHLINNEHYIGLTNLEDCDLPLYETCRKLIINEFVK